MAELPLAGTSALVTGGGSGIGLACARSLLVDGAAVTLMGRSTERLEAAAAELSGDAPEGTEVRTFAGDVGEEEAVASAVATAAGPDGSLDHVVASAGTGWVAPVVAQPEAEARLLIDSNLMGTFFTFKHGGAALAGSGGGTMVAISSLAAALVHPWMSIYGATKAGIDQLVRTAADELGPVGVRVHSVQPGIIETDLVELPLQDQNLVESYLTNTPGGRLGRPGDVASVVRFLCGPEAGWVNGLTIPVDGGQHLRRGPDYGNIARLLYGDEAVDRGVPVTSTDPDAA